MRQSDQKKIDNQIAANNLLNDRLREIRISSRRNKENLLQNIRIINEDAQRLLTENISLRSRLAKFESETEEDASS